MSKIYRVALIGAGIGERHIQAFERLTDKYAVTVICDTNLERAQGLAAKVTKGPKPEAVAAYDAKLLARADIDIVDICLPPFLHTEPVTQALHAGKHVVCEKPLVGSLWELDDLAKLAAAKNLTLMPIFQYRFGHGLMKARHLIATGAAGRVDLTSIETHWTRGQDYYAVPWRGKLKTELGGVFLGHAIHIHDMLTHLVGEVRAVSAATRARVNKIETEDCAGAIFEMADGSIAVSSGTLGSADEISRLRVCCQNLTMVSNLDPYVPSRDPWTFIPKKPKDAAWLAKALEGAPTGLEGYTAQFSGYYDALTKGADLPITLAEGRRSIELASAIYHSARTGERVHLPIKQDHPVYKGWVV